MSSETRPVAVDPRLEEAIAEFESAVAAGRPPPPEEFVARHATVAGPLRAYLGIRLAGEGRGEAAFPRLDDYEVVAEIGRGAMGVVYRARQKGTEQLVALKMLNPDWVERLDAGSRQEAVEQLRIEARAAARLRHPNAVPILHLGEHEGRPYFAMQLVEGVTLVHKVEAAPAGKLGNLDAARYLTAVAEAVHEAHRRGILHRDLKPHNVLVEAHTDEPKVTDFGLALLEQGRPEDAGGRRAARVVGTLPYMSPEQTQSADEVTQASDVYSLGATLYHLLTGRPPLRGRSPADLVGKIRGTRPEPPSRVNPAVSAALDRICLRCLEKDPRKRYAGADDLARALRGYLAGIREAAQIATMGTLFLLLGPVVFAINVAVYLLLQTDFSEPVVWLCAFSMYPALFGVFLLSPRGRPELQGHVMRGELWSVWGAKLFTAAVIAVALRVAFHPDARRAVLMSYPVFAALSGMAVFVMARHFWRPIYLLAVGSWLTALVMLPFLPWAPLIYAVYGGTGVALFGWYERRVARELG